MTLVLRFSICCNLVLGCSAVMAQLPFERAPIEYSKSQANDPVAKLIRRIESKAVKLNHDHDFGYLKSILKELSVSASSQSLVFAKNSLQRQMISPANPRAIYFNDETYVGYVPNGDLIEIASTDPMLGTVFYTIRQADRSDSPQISRVTERCLFCHASTHTGRVPGLMMQSVFTDDGGHRVFPEDSVFPKATGPLNVRWAGWFVTGKHGGQQHLGNLMIDSNDVVRPGSTIDNGNVVDLSRWIDSKKYLTPHSDLVALLVLQHQVSLHNSLTDANHRARLQLHQSQTSNRETIVDGELLTPEDAFVLGQLAEQVVDGLLMVDRIEFTEPVSGTNSFAEQFVLREPRDRKGRTLRMLDLQETVFTYPCSYLIYSESFDSLPKPLLDLIRDRLMNVLSGKDDRTKYGHLTAAKRTAILEILRSTKRGFLPED